jgi:hypothetical protein
MSLILDFSKQFVKVEWVEFEFGVLGSQDLAKIMIRVPRLRPILWGQIELTFDLD